MSDAIPFRSLPCVLLALSLIVACSGSSPSDTAASGNTTDSTNASVSAGSPQASGAALNDSNTGNECTSMDFWTNGDRGSQYMRPGMACIDCHTRREGTRFSLAGTLYVGSHEPDDCNGVDTSYSAQVVITDASGNEYTMEPNNAGNFSMQLKIATPYTAKVLYNGQERAMITPQSNGDCNACHTQSGSQAAPGRIQLPM